MTLHEIDRLALALDAKVALNQAATFVTLANLALLGGMLPVRH